ncbi:MAG: SLOG family protein [Alicyclobacillus sp.]|nr:SLOG family protein [Alicyclobacillus sp.]
MVWMEIHEVRLVLCLPSRDHGLRWKWADRRKLEEHIQCADSLYYVTDGPYDGPDCLMRRNRFLVDHSEGVLAVWDGTPSGTGKTIAYAKSRGIPIIAFHPTHKHIFYP